MLLTECAQTQDALVKGRSTILRTVDASGGDLFARLAESFGDDELAISRILRGELSLMESKSSSSKTASSDTFWNVRLYPLLVYFWTYLQWLLFTLILL